jgi:hypothetical protein
MVQVFKAAIISDDDKYRYVLTRVWKKSKPQLLIIGINPSTADASQDDPTIRRLTQFAQANGFGGFLMLNLFAYRASKTHVLRDKIHVVSLEHIIGPENDKYLKTNIKKADKVICMWGRYAKLPSINRAMKVYDMIPKDKRFCFGYNNDDSPTHPLFSPNPLTLRPFHLLKSSPAD